MAAILDGTTNTFLAGETDFTPMGVPSATYGGVWAYGYIGYSAAHLGACCVKESIHRKRTGRFSLTLIDGMQISM